MKRITLALLLIFVVNAWHGSVKASQWHVVSQGIRTMESYGGLGSSCLGDYQCRPGFKCYGYSPGQPGICVPK